MVRRQELEPLSLRSIPKAFSIDSCYHSTFTTLSGHKASSKCINIDRGHAGASVRIFVGYGDVGLQPANIFLAPFCRDYTVGRTRVQM